VTRVLERRPDRIRSALRAGRVPLGLQSFSGSPALLEIVGHAGFDFVMIDTEHASIDSAHVEHLVRACEIVDLTPLVRVSENSSTAIRKVLEAGARGVVVPQVRSAAEVRSAVDAARYPPAGTRGMCPSTRAARYSIEGWDAYVNWSNNDVLVIPILEHPDAIAAADEICAIDGIEIVNFGAGDLGMALGLGGAGFLHPEVQAAFDHVLDAAARAGKIVLTVPFPDMSSASCRVLLDRGVRVLLHTIDEVLFMRACREVLTELEPVLAAR
jgi:2-keto-3-deoxy-L-rhamnonate aldolase RhmA